MTNYKFLDENELLDIVDLIKRRNIEYKTESIYIMPEYVDGDRDILNELAPNISKILKLNNENCEIVYNKNGYTYLTLNDADIIFPLLFNIGIGLVANIIVYYIDEILKKGRSDTNIKVKFISRKNKKESYKQYEIEGNAESVIEALKILEKEDI